MFVYVFVCVFVYLCVDELPCMHAATHCHTLQHTTTHYNTLQNTAIHCNTLQHTATLAAGEFNCQVEMRNSEKSAPQPCYGVPLAVS